MKPRKKEKKKKKSREPKKSIGRDGGQTNVKKTNTLREREKKIPGSETIQFQS
jgi:hypothetical protein